MRPLLLLALLLFAAGAAPAQESYTLPKTGEVTAALERMKVEDPSRQLSEEERRSLCRLFVRAYVESVRRPRQGYVLNRGVPIYRLLVANFPAVASRAREGGSLIFLRDITRFFNTMPEYRKDVLEILRENAGRRPCR